MPTTITHSTFSTTDGGDFLDSLKVTGNMKVSERVGRTGEITTVQPFQTTSDIALAGGGDPAIALGSLTMTITGLSGGCKVVSKYEHTEYADNFDEYSCDAKHYPSGAIAS